MLERLQPRHGTNERLPLTESEVPSMPVFALPCSSVSLFIQQILVVSHWVLHPQMYIPACDYERVRGQFIESPKGVGGNGHV